MKTLFSAFFRNPSWIDRNTIKIDRFADFSQAYINEVKRSLKAAVSSQPKVSIILTTFNEEANIVRCLASISHNRTDFPFEIVLVNNNSTDNTISAYHALEMPYYEQPIQGSGPARQMGIENARGEYILLGDADCVYPETWIQEMVTCLQRKNTAVVYGRYSFLGDGETPRWQLSLYELMRDVSMEIRHFKRPFLNAYGISMAFIRDQALKEGFISDTTRGNDGRMCFDLMKYGKVRRLRSYSAAAWTGTRTLFRDGSFSTAFKRRIIMHLSRLDEYFKILPQHDTKTSKNGDDSIEASVKRIKKKTRLSSTSEVS